MNPEVPELGVMDVLKMIFLLSFSLFQEDLIMRIISAPVNRTFLYLNNKNLKNYDLILSDISTDQYKTTKYPFKIRFRHKLVYKIKTLLDYHKRVNYSGSYKTKTFAWYLLATLASHFSNTIEKIIIFTFRDRMCDELVVKVEEVVIFGFFSKSELFLYSSAVRKRKKIVFSICRWDDYVHSYIPKLCHQYESWGTEFTKALLKDIPEAEVLKSRIPFKVFNKRSPKKVVVYEGTFSGVSKDQQYKLLNHLLKIKELNNIDIVFKKLFKTSQFYDDELINLGITPFNTSPDFSDHGTVFNGNNDLSKLVPITKHVICFNISHAILEYGINSIASTCIITNKYMYTFPLAIRLRECGSVFIDINEVNKLNHDYLFNKNHHLNLMPFLEHQ